MQKCSFEGVSSADEAIEKPRGRSLGIISSSLSGGTCATEGKSMHRGRARTGSIEDRTTPTLTRKISRCIRQDNALPWRTRGDARFVGKLKSGRILADALQLKICCRLVKYAPHTRLYTHMNAYILSQLRSFCRRGPVWPRGAPPLPCRTENLPALRRRFVFLSSRTRTVGRRPPETRAPPVSPAHRRRRRTGRAARRRIDAGCPRCLAPP